MLDEGKTEDGLNFSGAYTKLKGSDAGNTINSGMRRMFKEELAVTQVRRTRIDSFEGWEQDLKIDTRSSSWKESLQDKKHLIGAFLDNNMIVWFPWQQELTGAEVTRVVANKYPNSKPVARFVFGERGLGMSGSDLTIISESESQDHHMGQLVDYFGRSLDWKGNIKLAVFPKDKKQEIYQADFQEYLSTHPLSPF